MAQNKPKIFSVLLTVTNDCNLSCTYCYETNKNQSRMSVETGKKIIRSAFEYIDGQEEDFILEIDFHGGEPLLNFPFIKEVCEWVWSREWGIPYRFFGTTNGTVLTSDVREWLTANRHRICFALSLDGTPEMNRVNRGVALKSENIGFFRSNWPKQPVKMTVSEETLPRISEGIRYVHGLGFNISVNLAYGVNWKEELLDVYRGQLDALVRYYQENPDIVPCSIFDTNLLNILDDEYVPRHCGAGKNMRAYDTEGAEFPCQLFSPNVAEGIRVEEEITAAFIEAENLQDEKCAACEIQKICPTCYGMNFLERGSVRRRDTRLCGFVKAEKMAVAEYVTNVIVRKASEDMDKMDYARLSAARRITELLAPEANA